MKIGPFGSIYVAFSTDGVVNTTLRTYGRRDIYVAQLSPSGNLNWITSFGSSVDEFMTALVPTTSPFATTESHCAAQVVSSLDEVYVTGTTQGSIDGEPFLGPTNGQGSDCFVAKLDSTGRRIWSR